MWHNYSNYIDNVIAEAYLKGIIGDIDWEKAYEVVKSNAENWRDDQTATWTAVPGKISTYITNGYIPADGELARMCCSKTIEYAYNDYLAAQMAKGLALTSEENGEAEKAASYTADYEKYIASNIEEKKILIINNIFSSLLVVKKRLKDNFDYEKIKNDILESVGFSLSTNF